jgi:hypothetical protein
VIWPTSANALNIPMEITKFRIKLNFFFQKRNFGCVKADSNVSLISPESSDVSVDFSERNASVAKTRNFELLCKI